MPLLPKRIFYFCISPSFSLAIVDPFVCKYRPSKRSRNVRHDIAEVLSGNRIHPRTAQARASTSPSLRSMPKYKFIASELIADCTSFLTCKVSVLIEIDGPVAARQLQRGSHQASLPSRGLQTFLVCSSPPCTVRKGFFSLRTSIGKGAQKKIWNKDAANKYAARSSLL